MLYFINILQLLMQQVQLGQRRSCLFCDIRSHLPQAIAININNDVIAIDVNTKNYEWSHTTTCPNNDKNLNIYVQYIQTQFEIPINNRIEWIQSFAKQQEILHHSHKKKNILILEKQVVQLQQTRMQLLQKHKDSMINKRKSLDYLLRRLLKLDFLASIWLCLTWLLQVFYLIAIHKVFEVAIQTSEGVKQLIISFFILYILAMIVGLIILIIFIILDYGSQHDGVLQRMLKLVFHSFKVTLHTAQLITKNNVVLSKFYPKGQYNLSDHWCSIKFDSQRGLDDGSWKQFIIRHSFELYYIRSIIFITFMLVFYHSNSINFNSTTSPSSNMDSFVFFFSALEIGALLWQKQRSKQNIELMMEITSPQPQPQPQPNPNNNELIGQNKKQMHQRDDFERWKDCSQRIKKLKQSDAQFWRKK